MQLPVRLKLTLWYTALLAGALLVFSASVFVLMSHSLVSNLDTSLKQRVDQLVPAVDVSSTRIRLSQSGEQPDAPFIPAALLDRSGKPQSANVPAALQAWLQRRAGSLPRGFHTASVGNIEFAINPIERGSIRVGYLLVWQSMQSVDEARNSLLILLLATGPILLLVAATGGTLLARRALSPVTQITQTAASISATDLNRRVPVGTTRDELSELATTFNAMIGRLQRAVDRERRFTSDASHELRAPLAVIMAEASLALEEPLDTEASRHAFDVIQEQATSMKEMIAALLTLARTESIGSNAEVFEISEVAESAVTQSAQVAGTSGVDIVNQVEEGLFVHGNQSLLTRALRNILDNGIKASRAGSRVHLRGFRDGTYVRLEIEDEGFGIEPDDLEKIFEPFYQVDKARTPGDSHGLGLAICRRIIAAHGGTVTAESTGGNGACFQIRLPAVEGTQSQYPTVNEESRST